MNEKRKATIYDLKRMCAALGGCGDCPLRDTACGVYHINNQELNAINEAVLKWCDEHPDRTLLEDFLEKFPKARVEHDSGKKTIAGVCPYFVGYEKSSYCKNADCCGKCWNRKLSEV